MSMAKPLATLHAGLIARATPRPVEPPPPSYEDVRPPVAPTELSTRSHAGMYGSALKGRSQETVDSFPEPEISRPARVIALRPTRIEVEPDRIRARAPLPRMATLPTVIDTLPPAPEPAASVNATPAASKPPAPKRRATTVRLEPQLHARLRLAREETGRSGQSILVEALNDWLTAKERQV